MGKHSLISLVQKEGECERPMGVLGNCRVWEGGEQALGRKAIPSLRGGKEGIEFNTLGLLGRGKGGEKGLNNLFRAKKRRDLQKTGLVFFVRIQVYTG